MLRVNGEELTALQPGNEFLKIYKDAHKQLEYLGLPAITIQEAKRKESFDAEGNKQHSNGCWITCTQRYQHNGTSYVVSYYENMTYQGEKQREQLLPLNIEFDGTGLELKNEPKEKVFFILFVDPQCEKIEGLDYLQNEIRRLPEFTLVQKERDLKQKIAMNREKAELEMMLYELENNHDRLLDVCYNFNIGTERKKDYELVENLMNIVLQKDSKGNFNRDMIERFRSIVKPANPNEAQLSDLLAFTGRLIDSGIVIPNGTANGGWYLDEEKTQLVCKWTARSGGNPKRDALANYFLTHKEEIPIYEEKMAQLKTA